MRTKKAISLLLSVCMAASLLTTVASAEEGTQTKVVSEVSFSGVGNPAAGDNIYTVQADTQPGLYTENDRNTASWKRVLYTGADPATEGVETSSVFVDDSIYCLVLSAQVNSGEGYSDHLPVMASVVVE